MPETESRENQKQKLTLGVNRDVIERARAAGINISELTEKLLTAVTMGPSGSTRDDVINAFTKLFDVMQDALKRYNVWVKVGETPVYASEEEIRTKKPTVIDEIYITEDDLIVGHDEGEFFSPHQTTVEEVLSGLYEPNIILQNMIEELTKAAEKNKATLSKLEFALKVVKALSEGELVKK